MSPLGHQRLEAEKPQLEGAAWLRATHAGIVMWRWPQGDAPHAGAIDRCGEDTASEGLLACLEPGPQIEEACQLLVGYRMADWLDIAANTAGITGGLLVAAAGVGGWALWLENRFPRPAQR